MMHKVETAIMFCGTKGIGDGKESNWRTVRGSGAIFIYLSFFFFK